MVDNVSDEWVNKGFDAHMARIQGCMFDDLGTELQKAFKAGIQYALKTPNATEKITPELMEERFNSWYSEQLKSDIAFLNNPYYECNEAWHASYQYALKAQTEGE